jgi:hypothetical protein
VLDPELLEEAHGRVGDRGRARHVRVLDLLVDHDAHGARHAGDGVLPPRERAVVHAQVPEQRQVPDLGLDAERGQAGVARAEERAPGVLGGQLGTDGLLDLRGLPVDVLEEGTPGLHALLLVLELPSEIHDEERQHVAGHILLPPHITQCMGANPLIGIRVRTVCFVVE